MIEAGRFAYRARVGVSRVSQIAITWERSPRGTGGGQ
jgi:hypothetical protein